MPTMIAKFDDGAELWIRSNPYSGGGCWMIGETYVTPNVCGTPWTTRKDIRGGIQVHAFFEVDDKRAYFVTKEEFDRGINALRGEWKSKP